MRCTPILITTLRSFRRGSRPQQESDRWIGQNSLRRSLMAFLLLGRSDLLIRCRGAWGWKSGPESLSIGDVLLQFLPEGKHAQSGYRSRGVEEGKRAGAERSGWVGHRFEGSGQSRESDPTVHRLSDGDQEAEPDVSGGSQTNCCGPARTLGEMEGGQTKQMTRIEDHSPETMLRSPPDAPARRSVLPSGARPKCEPDARGRLGRDFSPDPVRSGETQHKFGPPRLQNRGSEQSCAVPGKSAAQHARYVEKRGVPAN